MLKPRRLKRGKSQVDLDAWRKIRSGVSTLEMESVVVLKQTEAYIAEVTGIDALPYIPGPSDPSTSYGEEPRKGTVRPLP